MTIKELKEQIKDLPDDMKVMICGGKTEHQYGCVNSVYVKDLHLDGNEGGDDDDYLNEECLVLDEE